MEAKSGFIMITNHQKGYIEGLSSNHSTKGKEEEYLINFLTSKPKSSIRLIIYN